MKPFFVPAVFIVGKCKKQHLERQTKARTFTNLPPDEELISQVRSGLAERLDVLFDRYQMPLFNFFCKLLGNRMASEDLEQEVFFRNFQYRQSYWPGTPFPAWMYQIARNAREGSFRRQRLEVSWEPEMERSEKRTHRIPVPRCCSSP